MSLRSGGVSCTGKAGKLQGWDGSAKCLKNWHLREQKLSVTALFDDLDTDILRAAPFQKNIQRRRCYSEILNPELRDGFRQTRLSETDGVVESVDAHAQAGLQQQVHGSGDRKSVMKGRTERPGG